MANVTQCVIDSSGTVVTITWSEAVTVSNSLGLVLVPTDGSTPYPSCLYSSGSGSSVTLHTISRTGDVPDIIYKNEKFRLAYSSSFGDIADLDDGTPVPTFFDVPVSNNSEQLSDTTAPLVSNISITSSGRRVLIEFNEPMANTTDIDVGWTITGFRLLEDSRNGPLAIERASWLDNPTRTQLELTLNMTAFADESADDLFISYSGGTLADVLGNLLANIPLRAFDANNSEVIVRENSTSSSAKKFYMWMNQHSFESKNFYELRRDYPNTTIYRTDLWNEHQLWPSDTTDPNAVPYITSEEVEIPLNYLINDLSDSVHWSKSSTPHINLGILRAIMRGETAFESDFRLNLPLYLYDQIWWDVEPGPTWLSYGNNIYTQEEKDLFFEAMRAINQVTIEELSNGKVPIVWYRYFAHMHGRTGGQSQIDFPGGAPQVAYAKKNLSPDAIDDTPLFGERTFYPSSLPWQEVFDRNDASNNRVFEKFARHAEAHLLVAYAWPYMMDPNDPDLTGTSSEGIAGGLGLWKDWVQGMIDNVPEGQEIIVLVRSLFSNYQSVEDIGDFPALQEAPFDEDYWKGMIQYLLDHPRVDGIGYFARGIGMTSEFANGATIQTFAQWAIELIENYNISASSNGSTVDNSSDSDDPSNGSNDDSDSDSDSDSPESDVARGNIVNGKAYLTLRGSSNTQDLRYTVDGTQPTVESELYEGQIGLPVLTENGLEIRTRYFNKKDPSKRSLVTVIRIRSGEQPMSDIDQ